MNFKKLVRSLFSHQLSHNQPRRSTRKMRIESLESRQVQYAAMEDWQLWKVDESKIQFYPGQFLADYSTAIDKVTQPDGKFVEATKLVNNGETTSAGIGLARRFPDGKLDTSFGIQGRMALEIGSANDKWTDIELTDDGDIVVAGSLDGDMALVRFRADGSLDSDFGSNGTFTHDFGGNEWSERISASPDGSILSVGQSQNFLGRKMTLAKFNADGQLDNSYEVALNEFGSRNLSTKDIVQLTDGSLIILGDRYTTKLLASGEIQTGFAKNGWLDSSTIDQVVLQTGADGEEKLWFTIDQRIARFNVDGTVDKGFGENGVLHLQEAGRLAVSTDGAFSVTRIAHDQTIHIDCFDEEGQSRGFGEYRFWGGFAIRESSMQSESTVSVTVLDSYFRSFATINFEALYLSTQSPGPIASTTGPVFATPNTLTVTAMSTYRELDGSTTFYTAYSSTNGKAYMSDGRLFWQVYFEALRSETLRINAIADRHRLSLLVGQNYIFHVEDRSFSLFSTEFGTGTPVAMTWANIDGGYKLYVAANYFQSAVVYAIGWNGQSTLVEYPYERPVRWTATSISAGDVDGDGRDELYTALQHSSGSTYLYRSTRSNSIGTTIYVSSPGRRITSMTVGDTDRNRRDELFVAIVDSRLESTVYRSTNGKSLGSVYRSAIPTTSAGIWSLAVYDNNGDGYGDLQMAYKRRSTAVFAPMVGSPASANL